MYIPVLCRRQVSVLHTISISHVPTEGVGIDARTKYLSTIIIENSVFIYVNEKFYIRLPYILRPFHSTDQVTWVEAKPVFKQTMDPSISHALYASFVCFNPTESGCRWSNGSHMMILHEARMVRLQTCM